MVNLLIYEYFFRGKAQRKRINDIVNTDDIPTAQSLLQDYITEHDNYMNNNSIPNDAESFTSIDNFSLHHGFDHIQFAEGNQTQKQATIDALEEIY